MASITTHTDSSGNTFYKVTVSAGRRRGKLTRSWRPLETWSAKTTQRELIKFAAKLESDFLAGVVDNRKANKERDKAAALEAAKIKTLRQYVNGVFMPSKEAGLSPKTCYSYELMLNTHILPALGDFLLMDITPAQISKFILDFQRRGYAYSSVIKLYAILSGVFNMAFLDDSIKINPMLKVQRPKRRKDEAIFDETEKAFTVPELLHILKCAQNEPLKWQAYINLVIDTGIRRGEACALQWPDIDFDNETVIIRRNLQYAPRAGIYIDTPKNGKPRRVDIGAETLALLYKLEEERDTACNWIFTQDGTADPMHPDTPTRYFKRFGERYNINGFHPHKLRHTSASVAITNGADIVSVSRRLGHSDTAVTLRMYAHANDESIRRAGQAVRNAINAAQSDGKI